MAISTAIITVTEDGLAYRYRPGATFISVWPDTITQPKAPIDMIQMPDWVVRAAVTDEATLQAVLTAIGFEGQAP